MESYSDDDFKDYIIASYTILKFFSNLTRNFTSKEKGIRGATTDELRNILPDIVSNIGKYIGESAGSGAQGWISDIWPVDEI